MYLVAVDIRGSALPSAAEIKKGPYQSKEFVCVSNNRADPVDRLLILNVIPLLRFSDPKSLRSL